MAVRVQGSHGGNAKFLADGPPGQILHVTEPENFVTPENPFGPADDLPRSLSGPDAGKRALTNHLSFKFGNAGENLEQEAAGGILFVRVERLAYGYEPNAVAGECRQLLIQVEHRAAKTINLVDGDAVEFPLGGIGHELIQRRAVCFGPTESGVHVLPAALPVTADDVLPQFPELHFAILICRADTGVKGATHIVIVHYCRTTRQAARFPGESGLGRSAFAGGAL